MLKIAVFVSGGGTNLQSLIDECQKGTINGEIKLVVSNRLKAYGLERARNAGIKAECIKDQKVLLERLKEEAKMTEAFMQKDVDKICNDLLQLSLDAGGYDNVSVIVLAQEDRL